MRKEKLKIKRNSIYALQDKKHYADSQKGITLIALVVTIVVLLILAGVSINLIFSNDGIIKKAQEAADAQKEAMEKDQQAINDLGAELNRIIEENKGTSGGGNSGGGESNPTELPDITPTTTAGTQVKIPADAGWTSSQVTAISDGSGNAIPLPNDFYYVGGDYSTGLVISDKQGDTMTASGTSMGNQFVWIPVGSESDLTRDAFGDSTVTIAENKNAEVIKLFNISEVEVTQIPVTSDSYLTKTAVMPPDAEPYTEPCASGYETEASEYNTMRTQVLKYGGFYIGRYEAGINSTTLRTDATAAQTVVSKKGVAPYNYVPWGVALNDPSEGSGSSGAVYLAKNLATQEGYTSVTSTLCYGSQWDAMCRYIGDYSRTTTTKSEIELTGNVSTDVSKNIYDLAGNCREWTMEAGTGLSGYGRTTRGGFNSEDNAISYRYVYPSSILFERNGFRITLYIK